MSSNTECRQLFITKPLAQRFWGFVQKTESCWLWQGATSYQGYGFFSTIKRSDNPRKYHRVAAHRVAWELTHDAILPPDIFVCHNCPGGDNPRCVNPAHLFLGTQLDNMQDARRKNGRPIRCVKLTEKEVMQILRLKGRQSQRTIARTFGVSPTAIQYIHARKTWSHIELCAVEELESE